MRTLEVFNARAFRLALSFALVIALATTASFVLIYWQVYTADFQRAGAILVDEAARSEGDSESELRQALQLRLTRDIRRLDFVALFDPSGGRWPCACRSGTALAGCERRPRTRYLCRPQARKRRPAFARAQPAGSL
jgi:hypothetical protein